MAFEIHVGDGDRSLYLGSGLATILASSIGVRNQDGRIVMANLECRRSTAA